MLRNIKINEMWLDLRKGQWSLVLKHLKSFLDKNKEKTFYEPEYIRSLNIFLFLVSFHENIVPELKDKQIFNFDKYHGFAFRRKKCESSFLATVHQCLPESHQLRYYQHFNF